MDLSNFIRNELKKYIENDSNYPLIRILEKEIREYGYDIAGAISNWYDNN